MKKLLERYWKGYVRVRLKGKFQARFLNLCRKNGIELWNLKQEKDGIYFDVRIKDFFILKPFLKKCNCNIQIVNKCGRPFFFYQNRKRKAFFIGIGLAASVLYFLSSFIWNIHISGNQSISTMEILKVLEEENIVAGIPKRTICCQQITEILRDQFEPIVWVSAKMQGTELRIDVIDKKEKSITKEDEKTAPADLRSNRQGVVVDIVTRAGVPMVKPGQSCEKGTVLISGLIPITGDDGEVIRTEKVCADGDVYILHRMPYEKKIPRVIEKRRYHKDIRKEFYLRIGNAQFAVCGPWTMPPRYDLVTEGNPLYLTESFMLPIWYGQIKICPYETISYNRTDEELQKIAEEGFVHDRADLRKKGVEISSENVTISMDESACTVSGSLYVVERVGKKAEVEEETEQSGDKNASSKVVNERN